MIGDHAKRLRIAKGEREYDIDREAQERHMQEVRAKMDDTRKQLGRQLRAEIKRRADFKEKAEKAKAARDAENARIAKENAGGKMMPGDDGAAGAQKRNFITRKREG
jgi:hypothetical protein